MTTIINTPPNTTNTSDDSSAGVVIGIVFGALLVVLLLIFGLPYLRNHSYSQSPANVPNGTTNVNVNVPAIPTP